MGPSAPVPDRHPCVLGFARTADCSLLSPWSIGIPEAAISLLGMSRGLGPFMADVASACASARMGSTAFRNRSNSSSFAVARGYSRIPAWRQTVTPAPRSSAAHPQNRSTDGPGRQPAVDATIRAVAAGYGRGNEPIIPGACPSRPCGPDRPKPESGPPSPAIHAISSTACSPAGSAGWKMAIRPRLRLLSATRRFPAAVRRPVDFCALLRLAARRAGLTACSLVIHRL